VDVYYGLGDALKMMGQEVYPFELKDRLKFYRQAVQYFLKGTDDRVAWKDVYSAACQGLITTVVHLWPKLIIYITGQYIPAWVPALIKERFPHMKQVIWFTESPYNIAHEIQRAPLYDYVFTCDKACEKIYRRFNPNSYYLPVGYNSHYEWKTELKRWEQIVYTPDLFFVGSEVPGRIEFLTDLVSYIKGKVAFKIFGVFPSMDKGLCPQLEPFYIPITLSKYEVIRYYANSKIVLNHFRVNESKKIVRNIKTGESRVEEIEPYSLNPRVYEILAAGGFLMTDYRKEIDDLFVPGEDLVIYKDAKDAAEKIFYYLEHEEERKKIAQNGNRKIKKHTYLNRAEKLLQLVKL